MCMCVGWISEAVFAAYCACEVDDRNATWMGILPRKKVSIGYISEVLYPLPIPLLSIFWVWCR